ncbi:LexA/Signal peptidase, partial [Meira miltonrushii]
FINFITWVPGLIWFVRHVGSVGAITGQSMSPTLNPIPGDKDLVILNKYVSSQFWYKTGDDYKIGDVVMLISPNDPNLIICKRILALPGDIVSVDDPGQLDSSRKGKKIRIRIPPSHVWVEGDKSVLDAQASDAGHNLIRPSSRDSREFGPVPIGLITARVDMILWPPSRFG